ncbi:hypothetical protein C8R47DRAFT_1136153 [Mycena vitilis]|nr:hypothetical protein C8R47DRAFT_1136153 [Mycena vitilis]
MQRLARSALLSLSQTLALTLTSGGNFRYQIPINSSLNCNAGDFGADGPTVAPAPQTLPRQSSRQKNATAESSAGLGTSANEPATGWISSSSLHSRLSNYTLILGFPPSAASQQSLNAGDRNET